MLNRALNALCDAQLVERDDKSLRLLILLELGSSSSHPYRAHTRWMHQLNSGRSNVENHAASNADRSSSLKD